MEIGAVSKECSPGEEASLWSHVVFGSCIYSRHDDTLGECEDNSSQFKFTLNHPKHLMGALGDRDVEYPYVGKFNYK